MLHTQSPSPHNYPYAHIPSKVHKLMHTHRCTRTFKPPHFNLPSLLLCFSYIHALVHPLSFSFHPSFSLKPWAITHRDSREDYKWEGREWLKRELEGQTDRKSREKCRAGVNENCHWIQQNTSKHLFFNDKGHGVKSVHISSVQIKSIHASMCAGLCNLGLREVCYSGTWVTAVWHSIIY